MWLSIEEARRGVAEKIARARLVFDRRYSGFPSTDHAEAVLAATRQHTERELVDLEGFSATCPACAETGILWGDLEIEWQPDDYDEDGNPHSVSPEVTLIPQEFSCFFCDLELGSRTELRAVELDDGIPMEDVDPSELIDPDYFQDMEDEDP